MSLPVVDLSGSAGEQGHAHGRALAQAVAHNLAVYFDRLEREVGLSRAEAIARSSDYLGALGDRAPDYRDAMAGIAEGAGVPFDEVLVLNLRYELLYYGYATVKADEAARRMAKEPRPDGCTAFALLPGATADGELLVGQNWDWIPQVRGALLRSRDEDGLRRLAFTEAGIAGGKIGLNSAGVSLCINGMITGGDDWSRFTLPFHWRCHEILRARSFDAARAVIADEPRACTTNYLVAQAPDRVEDLEAAPDALGRIDCADDLLVHANHFEDPEGLGIDEPPSLARPFSKGRAARLRELLDARRDWSVAFLQDALRDHVHRPNSVCRHADTSLPASEQVITVSSLIMAPGRGRLWASDGPPCAGGYQELALD